jgi:hypothetical protein
LTDDEKRQLDAQALADTDKESRRLYDEAPLGPPKRLLMVSIRMGYIRKIIGANHSEKRPLTAI